MTEEDLRSLQEGDTVRNLGDGSAFIVVRLNHERGTAIAIRTIEVSNPDEWAVVGRSSLRRGADA